MDTEGWDKDERSLKQAQPNDYIASYGVLTE